jgi:hypothetical protein
MGSVPDEVIGFFNWPNPSSHTMVLSSIQSLTEIWTPGIFLKVKSGWHIRLTVSWLSVNWFYRECGSLDISYWSCNLIFYLSVLIELWMNLVFNYKKFSSWHVNCLVLLNSEFRWVYWHSSSHDTIVIPLWCALFSLFSLI